MPVGVVNDLRYGREDLVRRLLNTHFLRQRPRLFVLLNVFAVLSVPEPLNVHLEVVGTRLSASLAHLAVVEHDGAGHLLLQLDVADGVIQVDC